MTDTQIYAKGISYLPCNMSGVAGGNVYALPTANFPNNGSTSNRLQCIDSC